MKANFKINHLRSGGLITNYFCTSQCKHCLYASSPHWKKDYITKEILHSNLEKVKSMGCVSLHIGGGEPFLNLDALKQSLEIFKELQTQVEYVETNSSWFKNKETAHKILYSLKKQGLSTLLISISPFHNEFIPFYKIKGVIDACRNCGVNTFLWAEEFLHDLNKFDPNTTHSLTEYEKYFGNNYLQNIPKRYWVTFRGRALKTYAPFMEMKDLSTLLSLNKGSCSELLDTSHFHIDLFGNYLPGLCSGLAIQGDDLGSIIQPEKYKVLSALLSSGITGLLDLASIKYGFTPQDEYVSK